MMSVNYKHFAPMELISKRALMKSSLVYLRPVACLPTPGEKATATENRATLRRIKRNSRRFVALRAPDGDFDALPHAAFLSGDNRVQAFILFLFA